MQKNTYKTTWNTQTLVFLGLLVGMHLILTRILVIDLGFARITLGSICTIMAGLWFGPLAGGVSGFVSDILGCILKGYAVNPFITVAAILWGVIPALMKVLMNGGKGKKVFWMSASIVISSILCTLCITTAGLVLMLGYNFYAIMPGRLLQWAAMTPIYCVLCCCLYFSPVTGIVMNASAKHPKKKAASAA